MLEGFAKLQRSFAAKAAAQDNNEMDAPLASAATYRDAAVGAARD
jgi:hypothetical protein